MKIRTLMENTACRGDFYAEHGLSLYIEVGGHRILFDAGQSGHFADNGKKLGVNLKSADAAVLSHGHYDHGGGLVRFSEENRTAPIYLSRYAFEPHFNGFGRDIGLNPELLPSNRLVFVEGEQEIAPDIVLYSCNKSELFYPINPFGQTAGAGRNAEDYRHELYLLAEENGKRVLFSGCSHKGILNLVRRFRPDVVVGGFHLMKTDPKSQGAVLEKIAAELMAGNTVYYTGHCTGQAQFAFLKERMGNRLHALSAGMTLEI